MSTRMKFVLAIVTIVNLTLLARLVASSRAARDDRKQPEKPAAGPLEGDYTIVSGEMDGKPVPAEHLRGSVAMFTADRIVSTDKDRKEFFSASYTLNTTRKPWVIRMKSVKPHEGDANGLAKKDGDTMTLIYALPGGETPTEFKTRERQHLFVMKTLATADK